MQTSLDDRLAGWTKIGRTIKIKWYFAGTGTYSERNNNKMPDWSEIFNNRINPVSSQK